MAEDVRVWGEGRGGGGAGHGVVAAVNARVALPGNAEGVCLARAWSVSPARARRAPF